MPKVSVIIPTYNRSNVVMETIDSVLMQTLSDLEIIIIDDGSTDDTQTVIEGVKDNRVRYYCKENGGAGSARNLGLSKAQGKYVAFLDSDDIWPKNYLEVMTEHLEGNCDFAAAYSPIRFFCPDGRKAETNVIQGDKSGWIALDLFKRGFIWPSASIYQMSAWENFHFDEVMRRSYEDGDAFLRLSQKIQFLFVPEIDAFYRTSEDSIAAAAGVSCMRILVLERFYFKLGGDKIIPYKIARRRLSHAYRKVAEDRRKTANRKAALELYRCAIRYYAVDFRLYLGLALALLLNRKNDPNPDWQMPEPLGEPLGLNR